jgi:molybdopterin-guanine dinucleotide biosynthesis protein A
VGGRRIIDRVADALRPVVDRVLVVSSHPEAASWSIDATVVGDVYPGRSSLVGIHAALHHAAGDVIVVAWDMPFVTADLLRLLVDRRTATQTGVFLEGPSGAEPVCALYRPAALGVAEDRLRSGDARLHAFVDALDDRIVVPLRDVASVGDPSVLFANVNTAQDLERLS